MKTIGMGYLAFLMVCFVAVASQARMVVTFQQKDTIILAVKSDDGKIVTGDNVTFLLGNKEILAKASKLEGQSVHILYYEMCGEIYCADLRSAGEPAFDLPTLQALENGKKSKEAH